HNDIVSRPSGEEFFRFDARKRSGGLMDRGELIQEMGRTRLVAVVRSKSAEEALATAKAVAEGGVQFIEITFSVPSALDVIEILVAEGRSEERRVGKEC